MTDFNTLDALALFCLAVVGVGFVALIVSFIPGRTIERYEIERVDRNENNDIALSALNLARQAISAVDEARADLGATSRLAMGYVNDARVDTVKFTSKFADQLQSGVRIAEIEGKLWRIEEERKRLGVPQLVATALNSPRLPVSKRLSEKDVEEYITDQERLLGDGVIEGTIVRWIE